MGQAQPGDTGWFSASLVGKEMVDYICQYLSSVRERRVAPDVRPGYLRAQLPDSAPEQPDSWDSIFGDIERIIMPGVSYHHHKSDSALRGVGGWAVGVRKARDDPSTNWPTSTPSFWARGGRGR